MKERLECQRLALKKYQAKLVSLQIRHETKRLLNNYRNEHGLTIDQVILKLVTEAIQQETYPHQCDVNNLLGYANE